MNRIAGEKTAVTPLGSILGQTALACSCEDRSLYSCDTKGIAMSAPLVVSIPHHLGRDEAVRRLKSGLSRAASSVNVLKVEQESWEGDRMTFRVRALGQAAHGQVDVADDHVRLEVTLPWLLQRFAEVAQAAIRHRGRLLLDKRP